MEGRRHLRIRQFIDATWSMPGEDIAGQGKIINLSASGLLLQIDSSFKPLDHCVLSVDPFIDDKKPPFLNKKGLVIWFRKIQTSKYVYQCGLEFLKDQHLDIDLIDWIENRTAQMSQAMDANILNNYTG